MFPTVEVRWFLPGMVPAAVWHWFDAQGHVPAQPPRTDYYLRIANSDTLGVKLREGRIEVKQRHGQEEIVHFGRRAAGRVERWRKWSFALNEANDMIAELSSHPLQWTGVYKERKVRPYQIMNGETVQAVSQDGYVAQGCGWEVVKVRVANSDDEWWSLGFEAFGKETELRDTIRLVAEHVLAMDGSPVLDLKDSYGYPRWLQNVL